MTIDPISLAITIALTAASMAITASQTIEGPRMSDLTVTVADYGTPLNYFRGIRRLEVPVFYAEEIKEVREEHKTKGGKYGEYKYYGTWANIVADHEITSFRRCWLDRHLVYDLTVDNTRHVDVGDGIVPFVGSVLENKGLTRQPYRLYYGTEDQEPDERMVATVEAEEGPDTCPAYLGIAYVMFEEFPLENFGNRFPQVSIEADAGVYSADIEDLTGGYSPANGQYGFIQTSPDGSHSVVSTVEVEGSRFLSFDNVRGDYNVVERDYADLAGIDPAQASFGTGPCDLAVIDNAGNVYTTHWTGRKTYKIDPDGVVTQVGATDDLPLNNSPVSTNFIRFNLIGLFDVGGVETLFYQGTWAGNSTYRPAATVYYSRPTDASSPPVLLDPAIMIGTDLERPQYMAQDAAGDVWAFAPPLGLSFNSVMTSVYFWRVAGTAGPSAFHLVTGLPPIQLRDTGGYVLAAYHEGNFYLRWGTPPTNNFLVKISGSTYTVTASVNIVTACGVELGDSQHSVYFGTTAPRIDTARNQCVVMEFTGNTADTVLGDQIIHRIDLATMQLAAAAVDRWKPSIPFLSWSETPESTSNTDGDTYYPLPSEWHDPVGGMVAFPYRNDTIGSSFAGTLQWGYASQFAFLYIGDVRLRDICNIVAVSCKMPAGSYNFSKLDQLVEGYSWTLGKGRDIVSPLLEIYDSIIRPHGFKLEGLKRGRALTGPEIREEWFVSSGDEPRYKITMIGDTDLPRRAFVTFADMNAEQQPNTAVHQRNAVSVVTVREITIDLTTYASTADDIQPKVERWLRRQWIGSIKAEHKLTPRALLLEPGDIHNVVFDNEYLRAQLNRITIAPNRLITAYWERDGAVPIDQITTIDEDGLVTTQATADYTDDTGSTVTDTPASPGAEAVGRPPPHIYSPVDSRIYPLDIPLISDVHDQTVPFLYVAGGPIGDGDWPGVDIRQSDSGTDGSFGAGWDNLGTPQAATHGTTDTALPPALSTVLDEGSELIVNVLYGTLDSITDAQLYTEPTRNLLLVGDEIVQFRDAVLQSGGQWICTGLRRGVQGTEQHIARHIAGERVVLLNSKVKRHDLGASEIGDTDYYQGITFVRGVTDQPTSEVTFTAAAKKPLSPVHVELTRNDVTGDWLIEATRRTRIGGANVNGQDVPLGETGEAYKIRIVEGSSGSYTARTIDTTSLSGNLYTSAQQTTDWGSPRTTLSVEIVQMSPLLGIEGFPAEASA